jgi:hypothetical protein
MNENIKRERKETLKEDARKRVAKLRTTKMKAIRRM